MSRIGKKPIAIPSGVTVEIKDQTLKVKGPKGELALNLHPKVIVNKTDSELTFDVAAKENRGERALWGLFRSLANNMIQGVTNGFTRVLEINGVGYKAAVSGKKLVLNLGFSHPIELEIPTGLEAKMDKNILTISGTDKQAVGEFAAVIRSKRPPEPYKGKGIKYQEEIIRRKAGKVVKAVGGAK
jgi:large subunit ribosomal protein L6